jgi:hypothetical protein
MRFAGVRTVAMVFPDKREEVFLSVNFDGHQHPLIALKLANRRDIASLFNEDGTLTCDITGCDDPTHPVCLVLCCHPNASTVICVEPGEPGAVTLRCNDCGSVLQGGNFPGTLKLAPRPKAQTPYIYCAHHGLEPAYILCKHVLDGAPAAHLLSPDPDNYGEAMCEKCSGVFNSPDSTREQIKGVIGGMSCASGVNVLMGGKLNELLKAAGQTIFVGVLNMPTASPAVN